MRIRAWFKELLDILLRIPTTERSIGSEPPPDMSPGQVVPINTERVGAIYDYEGPPRRIVFLIFVSYAVSIVLAAILVGLVNFSA
jgi:hypothetical protein